MDYASPCFILFINSMYLDLIWFEHYWYVNRYFKILAIDNLQIVKKMNMNTSSTENRCFSTFVLKMTNVKSEINF